MDLAYFLSPLTLFFLAIPTSITERPLLIGYKGDDDLLSNPYSVHCCFVALLFYVHGKHLRSWRDGQLT